MLIDLKTMLSPPPSIQRSAPAPLAALRRDALRDALACSALLGVLTVVIAASGALGPGFAGKAVAVFALACMAVLHGLPAHAPHARFGAGNRVTLGRLALIAGLAGCIGEPLGASGAIAWAMVVVATVAALLDAVDGPFARADGMASEFGARFDMESDALLILVLSVLVLQTGKAAPWVLAAGLMRYLFVAAAARWRWLARPLPPSQRRKTICAVQIVSLIVCLGPVIDAWLAQTIAGAGLAALACSFAADVIWLARAHRSEASETAIP